jgi:hypothetical protein
MPSRSSDSNPVKFILSGIFDSTARAARVLGITRRHVFRRLNDEQLTRRQLRVLVTHGQRLAVKLHVKMGPHYSPDYRERAAARRARCLSAVAKAEALIAAMPRHPARKPKSLPPSIEPGHE